MQIQSLRRSFPPNRARGSPVDDRIDLGPASARSRASRLVGAALAQVLGSRLGLALLRAAMREPQVRAELLLFLSDKLAYGADFDAAMREPGARKSPAAFEDLLWLFSSNWLNHRFTRLDLDEAGYLYRLVRSLPSPRIAELGRFRGGTTVFFAAAGAHVVSIDAHPLRPAWEPPLERALEHLGLRDRVELVVGDTRTHPPGPDRYQLVFFDASVTAEGVRAEIEHWWPTLAAGGHAIFRDGRPQLPHLVGVSREVARLERAPDATRLPDADVPGCLVHVVRRGS
jgi:predicted O-methyltransferase YrrM